MNCCLDTYLATSLPAPPVNQFTFDIISGNEEGKFGIDATSRTLIVASPLDYDDPVNDRNVSSSSGSSGVDGGGGGGSGGDGNW